MQELQARRIHTYRLTHNYHFERLSLNKRTQNIQQKPTDKFTFNENKDCSSIQKVQTTKKLANRRTDITITLSIQKAHAKMNVMYSTYRTKSNTIAFWLSEQAYNHCINREYPSIPTQQITKHG